MKITKTYCDQCNVTHTPLMCFNKKRLAIKPKPNLTWEQTMAKWDLANPPDKNGNWICYLQISPECPILLTRSTLVREHVIPKSRGKKYKYDYRNIRPACSFCNMLKGSRTLEMLAKEYPHLQALIKS